MSGESLADILFNLKTETDLCHNRKTDDLRALAKIMDFLRAVSIILVVVHLYWYGYEAVRLWGIDIGVVDRVLVNFDRTAGLFHHILYTKLFALLLLALSCLGTKGVKEEKITWGRIWTVLAAGLALFFLNWWMLSLRFDGGGLCLPPDVRHVDEPPLAHQPHG